MVILGEAGIGKTRLTSEFVSSLGTEVEVLVGRCVSYGEGATYLPLAEIVRQAAPKRPQATIAELLEGDEHSELIAERMAELTGQAGSTARTGELFWAVRRFFEALAAKRPLVVVLEDIHWAEPTLLDLIEYLRAWTSEAPVLTLCIARPDLLQKRPGWGSSGETVPLQPLTGSETGILLAELPGAAELSDRACARIVEVAEGNALFVEQLLAYITDDVGPEGFDEVVPPSIEALIASRLDRLEPEERVVLERSAVIGKDFARSAVLHLSPPEALATVDGRLAALEARGMIQARRLRQSQEDEFRFHHVLLREVAYAGITKERGPTSTSGTAPGSRRETKPTSSSAITPSRRTAIGASCRPATRSSRDSPRGRASDSLLLGSARGSAPTRRRPSISSNEPHASYHGKGPSMPKSCASLGSPKGGRVTLLAPRKPSTKRSTRRRIADPSSEPGSNRPTFGSSANPLRTLTICSTSLPSRSRSSRSSVMTAALDAHGGTSDTFAAGSRAVSQTGEKQPSARSSTIAALDGQRQAA